ncbi:MAG: LPS translocon maturation chaperone LptM [Neisseriaceae bacterium]
MKKYLLILCVLLITGCGFKGPLYLPKPGQDKIEKLN